MVERFKIFFEENSIPVGFNLKTLTNSQRTLDRLLLVTARLRTTCKYRCHVSRGRVKSSGTRVRYSKSYRIPREHETEPTITDLPSDST